MQPDAFGGFASDDPRLIATAQRKGEKSFNRRARKPVRESAERIRLEHNFSPEVSMSFGIKGPPQADRLRVHRLACYQVRGFFYLITYDERTGQGRFWPGDFFPVMEVRRSDWGNARMRGFASTIRSWQPRLYGCAAGGFFKVLIRRRSDAVDLWAWALEWNRNFRIIGFFGNEVEYQRVIDTLPETEMKTLARKGKAILRFRMDVPLPPEEDSLFEFESES